MGRGEAGQLIELFSNPGREIGSKPSSTALVEVADRHDSRKMAMVSLSSSPWAQSLNEDGVDRGGWAVPETVIGASSKCQVFSQDVKTVFGARRPKGLVNAGPATWRVKIEFRVREVGVWRKKERDKERH